MFSDLSIGSMDTPINYPITDSKLPFSEYIAQSRELIAKRRTDLKDNPFSEVILNANSPFEFKPTGSKCGALLIHGLLDCPFSLRDIGNALATDNILCRSILLPGHGTSPSDLLQISYHDWIQAVRYGIESLKQEVDQVFLIGYSTGATLSVYHALQDLHIDGIVLLAPAIRIKAPVDIAVAWHKLTRKFTDVNKQWLYKEAESDYAKYQSIAFNAIDQVAQLTYVIRDMNARKSLHCPIYMAISREDETISSHRAIDFFSQLKNPASRLLLYTSIDHRYPDERIVTRLSHFPEQRINHCSHVSLPFAPDNSHYGKEGDYRYASHSSDSKVIFGAYNRIEQSLFDSLYQMGLIRNRRRELTYNPDFAFMAKDIATFIQKLS